MTQEFLKSALYSEQLSLSVLLLVYAVAFILGAIHALAPGHGKSLMAAYLVGGAGRLKNAIILAVSITIAHVFSVIIIGIIALWLTDFFWPERINRWIGLGSGIAIVFIGFWLLVARMRARHRVLTITEDHTHHLSDDSHDENEHDHDHHHHHHHHHDYRPNASIWSNIALGISGGIMPCPKAIVILLLAISLQRIALGISIILVFSLGLASVLLTLGILLVKAEHLVRKRMEIKGVQLLSVLGALVIILLGGFIAIQSIMAI